MWPVVVGHEFPDQPAFRDEREEAERGDAFADYALLQLSREFRVVDILDEDRLGFVRSRNPRGVSVDSALIMLRKAARGDEPHGPFLIEEQN